MGMEDDMAGILAGLKVIELGQVLAGPFVGAIFADLGAEVVKVERPEGGDDARRMGPDFRHGDALTFHIFNRGKASRAIDLQSDAGKAELLALAETADILVHNLRPGVPEALGVDGASLCAKFPRLIHGAISAFGHVGPMAMRPGFEPLLQGYSGLSSLNGGEGDPPMRSAPSLCDQGTAMWVVIGVLALLHRRSLTGRGGMVQGSLLETALMWAGQKADAFVNTGALPERHRSGHPGLAPYEAFEAADGPVLICAGNDRLFAKLAAACGHAEWMEDARFATNRARLVNKAALFAALCPVIAARPRAHWAKMLDEAGVPVSPINTLPEALAEPQVRALGMMQAVPGEDFALTALPISIDGARPAIRGGAPRLGGAVSGA
jgi:crotonobetainyl-CoA:carnitine CoA-transferase CaiB-like acyl-CoA transferase